MRNSSKSVAMNDIDMVWIHYFTNKYAAFLCKSNQTDWLWIFVKLTETQNNEYTLNYRLKWVQFVPGWCLCVRWCRGCLWRSLWACRSRCCWSVCPLPKQVSTTVTSFISNFLQDCQIGNLQQMLRAASD